MYEDTRMSFSNRAFYCQSHRINDGLESFNSKDFMVHDTIVIFSYRKLTSKAKLNRMSLNKEVKIKHQLEFDLLRLKF